LKLTTDRHEASRSLFATTELHTCLPSDRTRSTYGNYQCYCYARELSLKRKRQELSYRKQIARELRTQLIEGISVTFKSTLRVTQGHWKRNHLTIIHDLLLDELLDVEYYRDLNVGQRSLKVIESGTI